jgi:hypothetical protein
MEAQ